jgi:hypothetical protein
MITEILANETSALHDLAAIMAQYPQHAWESHCALAEHIRDMGVDPKLAHQAAATALHFFCRVDVTQMQEYRDIMTVWR